MNNGNRPLATIVAVMLIVVVVVGVVLGLNLWAVHRQNGTKTSLSRGYSTQSLGVPFSLQTHTWHPQTGLFAGSGTWTYQYTAALSESDALTAAKSQFGRGAYQVDANHPDAISTTSATLYRDLITEDVALKIVIGPANEAAPGSTTSTPVTLTLSPLAGE